MNPNTSGAISFLRKRKFAETVENLTVENYIDYIDNGNILQNDIDVDVSTYIGSSVVCNLPENIIFTLLCCLLVIYFYYR